MKYDKQVFELPNGDDIELNNLGQVTMIAREEAYVERKHDMTDTPLGEMIRRQEGFRDD